MKNIKEFSKIVIIALTLVWFLTAFFAMVIVWREPEQLSNLLLFVGAPMGAGLVGYFAKAAFENKEKIKQGGNSNH